MKFGNLKAELFQPPMGDDLSVVNAARVSFAKRSEWDYDFDGNSKLSEQDATLIRYLARGCSNKEWVDTIKNITDCGDYCWIEDKIKNLKDMATHWVPFTHTALSLRMSAPVPITVQCYKHKQGFTESGESRRYVKSEPEFFFPEFRKAAKNVKQGSSDERIFTFDSDISIGKLSIPNPKSLNVEYKKHCERSLKLYNDMINSGVAPEQARFVLPQGAMLNWIWTGNVASYARFYNQRIDSHSQKESQNLAKLVGKIVKEYYPVSWDALTNGKS